MEKRGLKWAIEYYSDEQVCIDAVANMRWPEGPQCPHAACGTKEPYYLATQKRWKCRKCRKQFSVKVGTIFEDSPIPLQKWVPAMWMLANCKNGVSSHEIGRALGITQKSAWFVLHRLRLAMKGDMPNTKLGGSDGGAVEVDESFFGGKVKNMHRDKRARYAAQKGHVGGATGKTAVVGMLDRETREIRTKVIPDVKRDTLQAEILNNVKYGSAVYTDDAVPYNRLNWNYVHEVVNHSNEYVRGQVHTNGLENFWSLFKRHLRGTYVAVEPFHLDRYLDEQVFRFNYRKHEDRTPMSDLERFNKVLSQVANKRLTYAELTGKTDDATQATPEPF